MQGVQVSSAFNDENRAIQQHGPAVLKEAVLQPSKQQASVLKSTRKAFGNITNTQPREVVQQSEAVKRRALGDISNSVHKQQAANKSSLKPNSGSALKPGDLKPGPVASIDVQRTSTPAWCATEPAERPAGKTWDQLQADREAAEDAEVDKSVQEMLAGFRSLASRAFRDMALLSTCDDEIEADLLKPFPLPAKAASCSLLQPGTMDGYSSECDNSICLADLLPDVSLPMDDQPSADSGNSSIQGGGDSNMHDCGNNCEDSNLRQLSCTSQPSTAASECGLICSSPVSADNQLKPTSIRSPEQLPW